MYGNHRDNIDDDYSSVRDLHRNKYNKKEPYIFTVTATNAVGDSPVSDPTIDVIPIIPLPSEPKNLTIREKDFGKGELYVSFQQPDTIGSNPILKYIIKYKSLFIPEVTIETTTLTDNIISNIQKGKVYTITVSAVNVGGIGPSSSIEYKMPNLPNPPNLINVISRNNKEGEVEIYITPPSIVDNQYPITGYTIRMICSSDQSLNNIVNVSSDTNINPYIAKLTKQKQYSISATSTSNIGTSNPSITINITIPDVPDTVNNITSTADVNSIKLQFKVPDNRGQAITGYKIRGYYTDSQNNIIYEDIGPITTGVSFDKDSINNVTLYTKNQNKYTKTPIQRSDVIDLPITSKANTNTLSTSIQPYARVPLSSYPIGKERTFISMENCYNYGILLFVLIFIAILWNCSHKK